MTLKKKMISCLGGVAGILVAVSAHAAPVCNTVAECQQLIKAAQARIQELQPAAQLGPIVKTAGGQVATMTQYDAQKYCESVGKRLPTAKELALALNPKGVHNTPVEGVQLPAIYKQDGSVDFYYDYSTYVRPEGDAGNYWFWSSSVYPNYSYYAYDFYGYDGYVDYVNRNVSYYDAVRCVGR